MHLIFLSGGSGKRLWPLSNGVRSKQFLELLRAEDGMMESMVQRVCRQFHGVKGGTSWDSVTVVAGRTQSDQLRMQLPPSVDVIIEPDRRDTFPAIAYAAAQLYHEKGVGEDEVIAVMPVDPFVDADYFDRIALIESELKKTGADIVLLGSKPEYPTEKFGYILPDMSKPDIPDAVSRPVLGFKEKPDIPKAKKLISEGALWNCGVFGMRLGYVLDILRTRHRIASFDCAYMEKAFFTLSKTSFDYEVVESAEKIRVIRYDGSWKDLGTWESLTEEMNQAVIGNVIMDESCVHSHIINELDIPIVVLGAKNSVVVASADGILVADKDETYRLKEVTAPLENRPMYEKKRWGEYFVLSRSSSESGDTLTKKLRLCAGKQISYQYHEHRSEVWTITSGTGIVYIDGEKQEVKAGETVSIRAGVKHALHAIGDLELIETQFGTPLIEEDIIRLEMEWE
ncbi:mannose-1-phosphate guanylyltransferase [Clostridia bacterium]|nr:mannose-1-phosphate guanylyltransferase [Clostridia bacterium]